MIYWVVFLAHQRLPALSNTEHLFWRFLGGGYAKSQVPLLITKTNEAEFQAERVIPVPGEKAETKKLKADGFYIKPVNPLISKATLRGMVIVK